ncbi:MAG: hypothetical protein KDD55_07775 [Bdellovibrionales bacterium]|nr:hypothetical protein [Bdellovibrionales bacterium]
MTLYMYIATLSWLCLVLGYSQRHTPARHVPLVLTGIVGDFLLVGYLQVTRDAVQTAASFTLGPLEMIHIGFSTLALVFYVPTIIHGSKIYRGKEESTTRAKHKQFAMLALGCRTLGFLFMFSMLK